MDTRAHCAWISSNLGNPSPFASLHQMFPFDLACLPCPALRCAIFRIGAGIRANPSRVRLLMEEWYVYAFVPSLSGAMFAANHCSRLHCKFLVRHVKMEYG